jgi:hypothetical protein
MKKILRKQNIDRVIFINANRFIAIALIENIFKNYLFLLIYKIIFLNRFFFSRE